jgi:hypothetical protein
MPRGGRHQYRLVLAVACVTALVAVGVCVAAVLAPAPAAAVPLVVALCVGGPMFACWDVPVAVTSLRAERAERAGRNALAALRRSLEQLPEVEHPLGQ